MVKKPGKAAKAPKKVSKPVVKGDVQKQLTDSELDKVAGGLRPRSEKPTLNPTGSDGCCN